MPDTFHIDRRAWELAKERLAGCATVSDIAILAQQIKQEMNNAVSNNLGK